MLEPALWMNIAVALGIGLLMGAERERDQHCNLNTTLGGVRTFALTSMLGMVTAFFHFWLFILAVVSVLVLTTIGYQKQTLNHQGITTEVALIFSVVLGGLCVSAPDLAAMLTIVVVSSLASKASLHRFVLNTMTQAELNHLLILAAASIIVYPLLPDSLMGPFDAVNPRTLWGIVIIVMAVSAFSHVLMRGLGSQLGLPITGFLSGFISSIATIASMATHANTTPALLNGAIAGANGSSLATILQLVLVLSLVSTETLWQMRYPLWVAGLIMGLCTVYYGVKAMAVTRLPQADTAPSASLSAALTLAGLIALVLIVSAGIQSMWGTLGIYSVNALAGLVDVHAPTIALATMVKHGTLAVDQAVGAILLAFSMNALTKVSVAYMSRARSFYLPVCIAISLQVSAMWLTWLLIVQPNAG